MVNGLWFSCVIEVLYVAGFCLPAVIQQRDLGCPAAPHYNLRKDESAGAIDYHSTAPEGNGTECGSGEAQSDQRKRRYALNANTSCDRRRNRVRKNVAEKSSGLMPLGQNHCN